MRNKIFLFLGPPGSGKGTLSELCIQQFGWQQLSTGNLCREHIAQGTAIGKQIQALIAAGDLVPDEIIAEMVINWIMQRQVQQKRIIFDGYPRTKQQAAMLYELLQKRLPQFELVLIKLNIDAKLLMERILNRVICSNKSCGRVYSSMLDSDAKPQVDMICDACKSPLMHRSDDTADSLKHRLQIYYRHEQDIIDFYIDKGLSISLLEGSLAIPVVFEQFKKIALQDHVC